MSPEDARWLAKTLRSAMTGEDAAQILQDVFGCPGILPEAELKALCEMHMITYELIDLVTSAMDSYHIKRGLSPKPCLLRLPPRGPTLWEHLLGESP